MTKEELEKELEELDLKNLNKNEINNIIEKVALISQNKKEDLYNNIYRAKGRLYAG